VELAYRHVHFGAADGKPLHGRKHQQLLLTSMPQAHPALEAHWIGDTGNVVLNDGAPHDAALVLSLLNATSETLTITPDTRFCVTLAGGPADLPGALATPGELAGLELTASAWTRRADPSGSPLQLSPPDEGWTVEDGWTFLKPGNQRGDIAIAPDGHLDFVIRDIRTTHPNGSSDVRVAWRNLEHPHRTLDGELVATLQKSPLVIVGRNVGIGTVPRVQLDTPALRQVREEAAYALVAAIGSSGGLTIRRLTQPSLAGWPCLCWEESGVGGGGIHWPGKGRLPLPRFAGHFRASRAMTRRCASCCRDGTGSRSTSPTSRTGAGRRRPRFRCCRTGPCSSSATVTPRASPSASDPARPGGARRTPSSRDGTTRA
jgi:hypothetical protein